MRVYYLTDPTVRSHPDPIPLQDNIIFDILFPECFPHEFVLGEALTHLMILCVFYSAPDFSELA